jgi:hypothetical protein
MSRDRVMRARRPVTPSASVQTRTINTPVRSECEDPTSLHHGRERHRSVIG